jgi:DNA repair exonuclease SbcCD ATPase subunit
MKIRSLEISNFRKFTQPKRIAGIGDGINVLVGPNEFGKSTLMEAINGVVFEKARAQSTQTRSFRHFSDRTTPEICLGFELEGATWTLRKRFAGQAGKAWLQKGAGQRFEDEEAEAELQRLLGFGVSGRTTEPGIWGTLWVRQGESFGQSAVDDRARQTLQGCLEAQVGVVTGGSRGRRLPDAVEAALSELTSSRGPRGKYKAIIERHDGVRAEIAELEQKRDLLFTHMTELASRRKDLRNLEHDWNERDTKAEIELARSKRIEAEKRAEELKTARAGKMLAEERANRADQELEARKALGDEIGPLEGTIGELQTQVGSAEDAVGQATAQVADREGKLRTLNDRQRSTVETGQRLQRVLELVRAAHEIETHSAGVAQIESDEAEAKLLAEQIGAIAATPDAVGRAQTAEIELTKAAAARDVVATIVTISLDAEAGRSVMIDGVPVDSRETTRSVVDNTVVNIEGVGRIGVQPQLADKHALLRRLENAQAARDSALQTLGVADLASAHSALSTRQGLEGKLDALRKAMARHAPGNKETRLAPGLDALKLRIEELRGRRIAEASALELPSLPDLAGVEQDIAENVTALRQLAGEIDAADAGLTGPNKALAQARTALQELRTKLASETGSLASKRTALEAARNQASDLQLEAAVLHHAELVKNAAAAVAELESESGETVAEINARILRLENAVRAYHDQKAGTEKEIARLAGVLSANEGEGIEERLAAAQDNAARLEAAVQELEQEVKVLELLADTLRTAEAEAKARYLAPVVSRVEPYLKMLLPGADLVLDENMDIAAVKRNGFEEEFTRLSKGTQEQIAVLTRLAFAELLLGQGRPATVILDDALVFSDDDRIERMFDILTRAADRTQIIVLTCRQRLFTRLGARTLQLQDA